jgi:crotonobetainyl-CoA:carnitine CoA-transferase CaiB-like acyl-CoA transferase
MPPIADFAGALQAALTISAALFRRERTGQGTYIDIGMCDVLLSWQMISLIDQWQSAQPELRGRCALNGGAAFYNIYPTKDRRFITLAALEEKFWRNFCLAVGHAEWISRRQEPLPQELLIGELKEFFSQRTLDYWIELLDKVDCCFEPVADLTDLFENHQLISRKMVTRPKHKFGVTQVNFPAWIDGQPPELRTDLKYDKIENVIARWNGRGL